MLRSLNYECINFDSPYVEILRFLFPSPASGNEMSVSPGRRFMIDLLVSSLMADGGLESALNAAITAEIQVSMRNG